MVKGDPSTRMYQMFAPDISRLGYDNEGRVWSIICPQQGVYFPTLGATLNIEVTVTGNRGWMDENADKSELFAADIKVVPTIWFSPDDAGSIFWQQLLKLNEKWSDALPLSKGAGIRINTSSEDGSSDVIQVRMDEHKDIPFPERARHWEDYAWAVANLGITIGDIRPAANPKADEFNRWVMDLFNRGSGNLLESGSVLIWNLWAGSPELVNQEEWLNHATYWRHSIDVHHRPPEGEGTTIADFNGQPLVVDQLGLDLKIAEFAGWIALQLLEEIL